MYRLKVILAMFLLTAVGSAHSAIQNQWSVSNAATNCNSSPHGLWTNNQSFGDRSCSNYFGFQAGSLLTQFDDDTATLVATAINPSDVVATINITYAGLTGYSDFVNNGGTVKGAGNGDETTWDFYTSATGTISIDGSTYSLWGDGLTNNTGLQLGLGANDKSSAFGASSWMNIGIFQGDYIDVLPHWDLNMELTAVPEPSILALFALGLVGMGFGYRRKNI